jgi:DNA-binding winged helix-turn-helix (wHTH) protein/TolB-like protein/Flp pilus assembly protein TadD
MSDTEAHFYEFGAFRLDKNERRLLREGRRVRLTPKAVETLLILVERSGHVVSKEELIGRLWPDSFVEENNLTQYISDLRKALGTDADGRPLIETEHRRGYRFAADARERRGTEAEPIFTERTRTRVVIKEEIEETDDEAIVTRRGDAIFTGRGDAQTRGRGGVTIDVRQVRRRLSPAVVALAALVALFTIACVAYVFTARRAARDDAAAAVALPPQVRSIAVLPFESLGSGGEDEYLGVGITDALISKLGKIRQLTVRPTSAVQRYAGGGSDPVAIGRGLNVDALLYGWIQRSGGHVRVTVRLLGVGGGAALWTEEFDDERADILTMQDVIAAKVAGGLAQPLSEREWNLLRKHYTENRDAYDAYLRGRYFWNKRTAQDIREAVKYFRQAASRDPDYAQAYAGLADAYLLGGASEDKTFSAKDMARKALALDDTLAEAHTALAYYLSAVDWDWAGAETEFRSAIELDPNYATAHHWYAYHLASTGRLYEAAVEIRRAREIDPSSLIISTDAGHIAYLSGHYDEAITQYRKVLEIEPSFAEAHLRLGEVCVQTKMFAEALAEFQKAGALGKREKGFLAYAYAAQGERLSARKLLREKEEEVTVGHVGVYLIASVYAALREYDHAFAWLEVAYKWRSGELALLKVDPIFESLRADPRFQDLLRRMNLAEAHF